VRGLFLLVGRSRGRLDAEGSRDQPRERANRLWPRRLPLPDAHDHGRRPLPRPGNRARLPRHDRHGRPGPARPGRPDPGSPRHPLCRGGASIDTLFAGAYNLAQFFGWEWGRYRTNAGAPRFTLTWLVLLVLALGIVMTGVDPVMLTEYAVIFSVVALPLTYLPILLVANDKAYMGRYANGRLANILGVAYLGIILAVSLSAIP